MDKIFNKMKKLNRDFPKNTLRVQFKHNIPLKNDSND